MKKVKWLVTVLVVASIALGIIGCSSPSGPSGSGNGGAQGSVLPEGFVLVKGTTITGTESWTPKTDVFVNGRSFTIPDLIVSDHEVTRGEYNPLMKSDPSWSTDAYDKNGNELEGDAATCDFNANGYRLPTEAEWEWLARGGQNYKYAGSNTIDDVAWFKDNTNDTGTREVKTKAPNGYGLYDMSGNVYEWCWDKEYVGLNPNGRDIRGGAWFWNDFDCSVYYCDSDFPSTGNLRNGFRVVRLSN